MKGEGGGGCAPCRGADSSGFHSEAITVITLQPLQPVITNHENKSFEAPTSDAEF